MVPQRGNSFSQRLPPGMFARRTSPPIEGEGENLTYLPTAVATFNPSDSPSDYPTTTPSIPSDYTDSLRHSSSCGKTSSYDRRKDMFQQISSLSGIESFDDPQHPVFMASSWISDEDKLQVCPNDPNFQQRYILALLYFYTSGDNWTRCTRNTTTPCLDERFLSGSHECDWGGISCDFQNRVTQISLDENNMRGSIPQELRHLDKLYGLDFDSNNLVGHFPGWVGSMKYLEKLDLDRNILSGPIPEELYSSTTLQYVDMDRNILSGTISSKIGTMSQLVFFQADFNQLIGTIPTEIGNISDLQYFSIFGNGFDKSVGIPSTICGSNVQIYANCEMCSNIGNCCTVCLPEDASNYY